MGTGHAACRGTNIRMNTARAVFLAEIYACSEQGDAKFIAIQPNAVWPMVRQGVLSDEPLRLIRLSKRTLQARCCSHIFKDRYYDILRAYGRSPYVISILTA